MISIIICSRKADISQELKDNIAATIGCEYELCVIDNSRNEYNIFTAYNEGVRRAKGDVLCFMHEDILFRCKDWGNEIQSAYSRDAKIGAIGVVGSQYLSKEKVAWWDASPTVGSIIQGRTDCSEKYHAYCDDAGKVEEKTEVVVLDGCFVCVRSSLFERIKWDEATYSGFHIYDMDICMQVLESKHKVCVIPTIELEHQSSGIQNDSYYMALAAFCVKWGSKLPIYRGIFLKPNELQWRERILQTVSYEHILESQITQIRSSKAYRLGKLLLTPFRWMKRKE